MQTVHRKKSKKNIIIISIAASILVAAGTFYYLYAKGGSVDTSENKTSTQSTTTTPNASEIPQPEQKTEPTNTDHAETPVVDDNGIAKVPVVTSVKVDGTIVYIRGGINTPDNNGSCFASLVGPSGEKMQKNTTIMPGASTADCKTIQINTAELSKGTWTYTLNYTAQNIKGTSNETTFTIK